MKLIFVIGHNTTNIYDQDQFCFTVQDGKLYSLRLTPRFVDNMPSGFEYEKELVDVYLRSHSILITSNKADFELDISTEWTSGTYRRGLNAYGNGKSGVLLYECVDILIKIIEEIYNETT